ncbi:hypothetical protein BDZ89DRAFT_1103284 [Hymenopellis radicata]|nr:hypothetical protein BDZ89DRAFT_1103284 [Hymenopellis radicata]
MIISVLHKELKLCWGFVRRDLGTGLLPVPAFTLASLLYKNTPTEEMPRLVAAAFLYGFLYLYSFVVANQITGVDEDKINKPDRPIASGATSLKAATIRYYVLSALYFGYSYVLGVQKWTLLWIATTYAHNFLGFSNFGPTKDMCMGLGAIAQLMAAWAIGDLRDVPGDLKAGRRTTPIILGDTMSRIHITAGIFVSQYLLIKHCILQQRDDATGRLISAVIALMSLAVVARLFAFRTLHGDRISYWVYTVLYVFQPVAACVTLKAQ